MATGIELLFNMRTNSQMFERGFDHAENAMIKFYKSFQTNLDNVNTKMFESEKLQNSFKDMIKRSSPIVENLYDKMDSGITLTLGDELLLNKALSGATHEINQLNNSFEQLTGLSLTADKNLENLSQAIMEMDNADISNLNKSMNKFVNNINRFSSKQQKQYMDLLHELQNAKTSKEVEVLQKKLKGITDLPMKDLSDKMSDIGRQIHQWVKWGLGLGSIQQIFSEILNVQTELTRSAWSMGQIQSDAFNKTSVAADGSLKANMKLRKDVRATAASYMKMNRQIAAETQTSLSEVGSTMTELMNMRVGNLKGDFKELASTSMLMQKALGMSSGTANRFIHDLSLIGGVGAKDIKKAAQEMSVVQQNLGLTDSEAQLVGATVGKLMRQFRALGGSAKDVSVVTREVSKMTAAFASVGLAADDAQSIIQNMMNPDNLEKSVMLWSSMGMSAAEGFAMMNGEGKNMLGMTEKMVGAAKRLKEQYGGNVFALKAMAEANGLTLEQVQALSQYDAKRLKDMKKQAKLEEAAAASRQGLNDQMKRLKDQLMVILQSVLLPFLKVIGGILEPIVQGLAWVNKEAERGSIILKIIANIIKTGIILSMLSIMGWLPKIISLTKILGGLFGGIKDKLSGVLSKFSKSAESLNKSSKGLGNKIGDIGKGFRKFPSAKKILALGVALLLVGAGISLIITSLGFLVKAVGDANLSFKQLAGMALMLTPVMAGLVAIMYFLPPVIAAIGVASTGSAPGLLALGAAVLMVGAGFTLMGVGVMLAAKGIMIIVKAFIELGKNIVSVVKGIVGFSYAVASLSVVLGMLTFVLSAMAIAFVGSAAATVVFIAAMLGLAATIPLLTIIAVLTNKVGQSILNMGTGAKLMADNFSKATEGLKLFKAELGGGWKKMVDQVVNEINRMNEALQENNKLTLGTMSAVVTHVVTDKMNKENKSTSNVKQIDYTSQLNIANEHLGNIESNTSTTNKKLDLLITAVKTSARLASADRLISNIGASG